MTKTNSADRTSSVRKRRRSRRNKKLRNIPTNWRDQTGYQDFDEGMKPNHGERTANIDDLFPLLRKHDHHG